MKKILLLTLLSSPLVSIKANVEILSPITDIANEIYDAEKENKDACLEYEQNFINDKFELMKKQNDDLFKLNYGGISLLKKVNVEEMLMGKAPRKLALLNEHLDEWKELCEKHRIAGERLYNEAKSRLARIKSKMK